ncbi:hypothetical protein HED60_08555 [Planctomycetales bacterium ZRK34]|nr:hypothetical protein HED60_08555 [Planctomycetales bacterium ZRK34]
MRIATLSLTLAVMIAASASAAQLAGFNDDYQGTTPATGWSYLWNAPLDWNLGNSPPSLDGSTNPLGTSANYVPLIWNGSVYTADGDGTNTNGVPANYLRLGSTGGHPGRGSSQGEAATLTTAPNAHDRAPIAAYTIQSGQEGPVYLTNSFLTSSDSGHNTASHTLRIQVYVNDTLKVDKVQTGYGPGTSISYDAALGNLTAGDTVYVAMSPDGQDGSDTFSWDFTLSTVANTSNGPIIVADLVDDYTTANGSNTGAEASFANLGNGWSYMWNAPSDWNLANDPNASSNASDGDITSTGTFLPLISSGTRWSPDGNNANLDNPPARYMNSGGVGSLVSGHPGAGSAQPEGIGNDEDRYVIYAYTVDTDGLYAIVDSVFSTGNDSGDGNNVRIFTSLNPSSPVFDTTWDGVSDASFNTFVGSLSAGDIIYVAVGVGSSGLDGADSYALDFSIAAVPTPAALPAGLMMLGLLAVRRRK